MTEQDIPLLHEWLQRPHIVEWWGGEAERPKTLAETRARYLPRVLAEERVTPYIAMQGDEAIGYAQSYVALGSGDGWWEDETDPGVRGIDQSLARPELLGRGLGTQLVNGAGRAAVRRSRGQPHPDRSVAGQPARHPLLREGGIPQARDDRHAGRAGGVHGARTIRRRLSRKSPFHVLHPGAQRADLPAHRPGLPVHRCSDRPLRRHGADGPRPARNHAPPRQRPSLPGGRVLLDGPDQLLGRMDDPSSGHPGLPDRPRRVPRRMRPAALDLPGGPADAARACGSATSFRSWRCRSSWPWPIGRARAQRAA